MELIAHRLNKINELRQLPKRYGVEIDLRSRGSEIILHHDPYKKGEKFENYLQNYNHGTLILNVKESGIEDDVIKKTKKFGIKDFFLLDVEMPYICKNKKASNKYIALRYSEFEPEYTIKKFTKNVGWVWIDTFTSLPLNLKVKSTLKKFKTCLVCPERWGRPKDIQKYFNLMKRINFFPNSLMTSKNYFRKWENLLEHN
jgi:hypothetical protein